MLRKLIRLEKIRKRFRRKLRIRNKVNGTAAVPRVSIFRSNKHVFVQAIDDEKGATLAAVSSTDKDLKLEGNTVESAKKVGAALAEKLLAKGVQRAVFDRNGYRYHGKIAAVAEAMREKKIQI